MLLTVVRGERQEFRITYQMVVVVGVYVSLGGGQGRTAHLLLHKSESQSQNGGEKCQGILAQTPREMMTRRNILIEILIEAEGVTYSTISKDLPRTSYTGTVHSNLNQG